MSSVVHRQAGPPSSVTSSVRRVGRAAAGGAGLTLVHFSAQRKHILWDTLGA